IAVEERTPGLTQDIDEPGGDDELSGVDPLRRLRADEAPGRRDGDHAIAADGDVSGEAGAPGTIHDLTALEDDVARRDRRRWRLLMRCSTGRGRASPEDE